MSARDEILARVRAALAAAPPGAPKDTTARGTGGVPSAGGVPEGAGPEDAGREDAGREDAGRDDAGPGGAGPGGVGAPAAAADLVALLAERLADYRAIVHRCHPPGLAAVLAAVLAGSDQVVAPADLPEAWLAGYPGRVLWEPAGSPVPATDLDRAGTTVVTGCAVAVAETGTLILDSGPRQGRRVLTLVPDHHVCVVHAGQIVRAVPAALARLPHPGRPLTLVSGPSATSDIELNRVEGVHGPRRLEVILVESPVMPG